MKSERNDDGPPNLSEMRRRPLLYLWRVSRVSARLGLPRVRYGVGLAGRGGRVGLHYKSLKRLVATLCLKPSGNVVGQTHLESVGGIPCACGFGPSGTARARLLPTSFFLSFHCAIIRLQKILSRLLTLIICSRIINLQLNNNPGRSPGHQKSTNRRTAGQQRVTINTNYQPNIGPPGQR